MKTKKVPFDIERAKAGAKVVTRKKQPVRILDYNLKRPDTPIVAAVMGDTFERVFCYKNNGKHECKDLNEYDLFIEEEVKTRSMTNQELADWLRDCPEEHREWGHSGTNSVYPYPPVYFEDERNEPVEKGVLIRRNHGGWQEPLVEE